MSSTSYNKCIIQSDVTRRPERKALRVSFSQFPSQAKSLNGHIQDPESPYDLPQNHLEAEDSTLKRRSVYENFPDSSPGSPIYCEPNSMLPVPNASASSLSNRSSGVSVSSQSTVADPYAAPSNTNGEITASKDPALASPDSQFEDYQESRGMPGSRVGNVVRFNDTCTATPSQAGKEYYNLAHLLQKESESGPIMSPSSTARSSFSCLPDYADGMDSGTSSLAGDSQTYSRLFRNLNRLSLNSSDSVESRDVPNNHGMEITLNKQQALERFNAIQRDLSENSSKLFRFIHGKWKTEASLSTTIPVLQTTCRSLVMQHADFIRFCQGVLANANESADRALPKKIWKHLRILEDYSKSMTSVLNKLDALGWRAGDVARAAINPDTDYLSSFVSVTRGVSIEVRALTATIYGNSSLLFPDKKLSDTSQMSPIREDVTQRKFSLPSSTTPATSDVNVVQVYAAQIDSHSELLQGTLDEFLKCLSNNQPPNVFVAHSKFLLRSATQLVYIASGLCSALQHSPDLRALVEVSGNALCEILKSVIMHTKAAAAEYPSAVAVQKLIGTVNQVRTSSQCLRDQVRQAAATKS